MTRILHLTLSEDVADGIAQVLSDASMNSIDGFPEADRADRAFESALNDAKATKTERLQTWLGHDTRAHIASVERETEPDGDGTYTTLRVAIGPEMTVSRVSEVLGDVRRHILDFVGSRRGR